MVFGPFTRRQFMAGAAAFGANAALTHISLAANPTGTKLHGLSSFGDLKYGPDYKHFDYAQPDAPQGGTFAFNPSYWYFNQNAQTFNTLNSFVLRGEAPPRMELCFDYLMVWAIDEPDALYCAVAKSVEISEDRNTYRFTLREEARFHDGNPVSAEDVAFSYSTIAEKGHPHLSQPLRYLNEAVVIADDVVELRFNGKQSDRVILTVANSVPIFSTAYYSNHEFDATTLTMPLASGPWRIDRLKAGTFVEYAKVKDYWAKNLPFAKGLNHFDRLRIDFYRERTAAFEAFKKGNINWREEFTSKVWATEYDFPAINDGRVKLQLFSEELRPSMQGWAVNSRKQKFANPLTREAIGLCFDFEWTNENLFHGAYTRSQTLFASSPFEAIGEPSPEELKLLEPFRDQIATNVFEPAFQQHASDGSGNDRKALRKATKLLNQAGWTRQNGKLVDAKGEPLTIEFLIRSPIFERILAKYVENLGKVGIAASINLVDPSQFQSRIEEFDFDIMAIAHSFGASPTAESMRQFLHSDSASREGSFNYPGIQSPVLDALLDRMDKVANREELTTVLHAMDRVLRSLHLWIPNWYAANHRVAYWDMFGWKDPKPDYQFPVETIWWFDIEKARAIGKA